MGLSQSALATTLVLVAALLHALWNAVLKINGNREIVVFLITGGAAIGGMAAAFFLPFPEPASWPFLVCSSVIHCAYLFTLSEAYRHSDFSVVYPIARGGAPAMVLLVSLLFLDEALTLQQVLGICLLAAGIVALAIAPLRRRGRANGVLYAGLTACFIAGYSINDGLGARAAGNPHSYAAWLFVCQFIPVCLFVIARYRVAIVSLLAQRWRVGLTAGLLSLLSYWLVIWAMTIISVPVAVALRETSVVFALLLGVFWLNETWSTSRSLAVALVIFGALLIQI